MLAAPACDAPEAVTLVLYGNATAETTWVLSSVGQTTANSAFGFVANITSLARLNGACAANNATSLGVEPVPSGPDGPLYGSQCNIEDRPFLIPGANVSFDSNAGGWALLPVSPSYCRNLYGQCAPGESYDSS